jgi:Rrf2 family protein
VGLLSRTQEYALRAALFLGRSHESGSRRTSELAKQTSIPRNYLSKILHQMAREGLIDSERGRTGGVRLARSPDRITLDEIITPFRPATEPRRCVLGRPECSDEYPCGAHDRWKNIAGRVDEFFQTTTIADVMAETPSRDGATN